MKNKEADLMRALRLIIKEVVKGKPDPDKIFNIARAALGDENATSN